MKTKRLLALAIAGALCLPLAHSTRADDADTSAPTLSLDKNPRIIAYQLKRHSNKQLTAIERSADDPKFRPVFEALLTRKGLEKKYREEAVAALAKIDKSDAVTVLLDSIAKIDAEDKITPRELASLLMAQKPAMFAAHKEKLESLAKESESSIIKQAAYAGLASADGKPDGVWKLASENSGLAPLLAGIPMIADAKLREAFYSSVKPLAEKADDDAVQIAALEAISSIPMHEAEAFQILASVIEKGSGGKLNAAIRSIGRIPASKWPKDQTEPLAQSIVKLVEKTPAPDRTGPAIVQAVQLGNDLAGVLPAEKGAPIRKSLRELAVRVVVLHTLTEQMMFDLHYFTVQAGKPVQIVLDNTDNMPHNLVITTPGGLTEVGMQAGTMTAPDDPKAKAYIPDTPKVLESTPLVQPGESITLSFSAPAKPGNYNFLCTYPGHWVKMYGTMQVVADLDEYEKKPIIPKDPINHKTYESQKNEGSGEGAMDHAAHEH
jgi:azurin